MIGGAMAQGQTKFEAIRDAMDDLIATCRTHEASWANRDSYQVMNDKLITFHNSRVKLEKLIQEAITCSHN